LGRQRDEPGLLARIAVGAGAFLSQFADQVLGILGTIADDLDGNDLGDADGFLLDQAVVRWY